MKPAASFLRAGVMRVVPGPLRGARWAGLLLVASTMTGCLGSRSAPRPSPTPLPPSAPAVAAPSSATAPVPSAPPSNDPATRDDVVRTAVSVFGDSAVTPDSAAGEVPVWDIDVRSYETHDRVEHYVDLFTTTARERFVQRLARGTRYQPMIRAKLRASGMPEDLTYLALIESGYDPHAYSRAAAVGMWQFMSSTARAIGLRVDWWMDERRDPARSTDGAIKFLGFLQKQFGSLYLAAAAYNGGPGRVSKGLTRFAEELEGSEGEDRFFALAEQDYLRAETKNYVPQLIAAALVAKMPARYGIRLDSVPPYAYDSVRVGPGTSLMAVAAAGRVPHDSLRDLNPALLRGIAPPDASVWLRVPVGSGASTQAALDSLPADALRGYTTVTAKGTLTATSLASAHGVTLKQLRWFNPTLRTTRKGRLVAGQAVRIPRAATLALARDIPDPSLEKYGGSEAATGTRTARRVHVVRRGETIGGIARQYGLSERQLKAMNGIRGSRILAGQTLQVRSTTVSGSARATTSTSSKSGKATSSAARTSAKSSGTKGKVATGKGSTAKAKATKSKASTAKRKASTSARSKTTRAKSSAKPASRK